MRAGTFAGGWRKLPEQLTNRERKCKTGREGERVRVPAPEISLMAAVSFYLMEGGRGAAERDTEKAEREMKR